MKVLLDQCVDIRFGSLLEGHEVLSTKTMGWEQLNNGNLLATAEEAGFQVFVTVDKNLRHQQNIAKRKLAVMTLSTRFSGLDDISPLARKVVLMLDAGISGGTDCVISDIGISPLD